MSALPARPSPHRSVREREDVRVISPASCGYVSCLSAPVA